MQSVSPMPPEGSSRPEPAALSSMTGFARQDGGDRLMNWTWELKSVNGRNLDMRFRLPSGFESLEQSARGLVAQHCRRGNVQIGLTVQSSDALPTLQVNKALLDQLIPVAHELQRRLDGAPPRAEALLAIRGVVETVEPEEDPDEQARRPQLMYRDLERAVQALVAMRQQEGARLARLVGDLLQSMVILIDRAAACAAAQPAVLQERLQTQVAELLDSGRAPSEDRLAQEVALLVAKADVREEMDRLSAHVDAARDLLTTGGAVGRRLDFLCQEFNREVNTLCSKSSDIALTRIGLDLKSTIDQLREQIQNIE